MISEDVIIFFKKWNNYNSTLDIINTPKEDAMDLEFLFEEFFKKFDILNSKDFDINKYFYDHSLPKLIISKFKKNTHFKEKKPSITVAHMIEVAKRKEWFDPE